MYQNLQQHRTVLPAIARLLFVNGIVISDFRIFRSVTDLILLLILFLLGQKAQGSIISNRIGMKFAGLFLKLIRVY